MKKLIAALTALMLLVCGCISAFAEKAPITKEDAMKIVLDYAGLKEEEVTFTKLKLDLDDGRQVYEIGFICNGIEYEFDVDVRTGRILETDMDNYVRYDRDDDWDLDDWFDFD